MAEKVRIIGIPMDLGQSRRGVDMGPSALRVAGLQTRIKQLGHVVEDVGNLDVKQPEEQHYGEKRAKYLAEIALACKDLAKMTEKAISEGFIPVVLGGDHSIAIGSAAGIASHFKKKEQRVGCLWLDAHGDMNTPESSPSGNIHGMPLASLIGHGAPELAELPGFRPVLEARNVCIVGARDLDARERKIIKQSGIHVFTMRDIDERGMRDVMAEALRFAMDDADGVHVSLDLDFVDPEDAPGVGTPVRGGVTYREAHLAMEMIADSEAMVSLDVVEINPVIDLHNKTAQLGVELVLSSLGNKIL